MAYVTWSFETLDRFCKDAFKAFGFNDDESALITEVLLTSDLYGIESHGMQRMVRYHKGIEKGQIHLDAKPEVVFETPMSAVIDGHSGMGQLISKYAMDMAIEKAEKVGVGIVTVRESNHYGIAGYYAQMASKRGLIGFSCTNSEAIMVPTFGKTVMLGSNPLAFAVPADPYPFLFDASTTVVTRGKVEIYNKANKPLPDGWAIADDGLPTSDAPRVLGDIVGKKGGGILPLGGATEQMGSHKGYGYGMIAELFSSILSQGVTSDSCCTFPDKTGICHGFAAIDTAMFGNPDEIKAHFSAYLQRLRDSEKAAGCDRIYTHGEKEVFAEKDRRENGIQVNDGTMIELLDLCKYLNIDPDAYFPGYKPADDYEGFSASY